MTKRKMALTGCTWVTPHTDREPRSYCAMQPRGRAVGSAKDVRQWRCECGALSTDPVCYQGHAAPWSIPEPNPFHINGRKIARRGE